MSRSSPSPIRPTKARRNFAARICRMPRRCRTGPNCSRSRSRCRLDRHAALYAFGGHYFRARSRQACFLSGPDGDGSGGSGRNARDFAAFSRAGHDALPAALRVAGGFVGEETCWPKITSAARTISGCKVLTATFLDPDAAAHWRQRIEISGLNVMTLGIYVEGIAALARRHHRRFRARENRLPGSPGL